MAQHTPQDITKIIQQEEAMHQLTWSLKWSHGDADVNKMETDVVQVVAPRQSHVSQVRLWRRGQHVWSNSQKP